MKEAGTIELVISRAKPTFSREEIMEGAKILNNVIQNYPGFISRSLSVAESGEWVDIVKWTDLKSAKYAAEDVMKDERCLKVFDMLEQADMIFLHLQPVMEFAPGSEVVFEMKSDTNGRAS